MEFVEEPPAGEEELEGGGIPFSQSITLEITPPMEGEAEIWDFYSVTPLQVTMSSNETI